MNQLMTEPQAAVRPWQCRGRCTRCGTKISGCRRVRRCGCGAAVSYR